MKKPKDSALPLSRPRQLRLIDSLEPGRKAKSGFVPRTTHGGYESSGKRKTPRPFTPKAPMHLVLKSARAKGAWSLRHRKNHANVTAMIYVYSARFKVKVYRAANVGNHLHLLVKATNKKDLADYLRVLAGRIAITVSGARKHRKRIGRFWDHLYWSRLVAWKADFHRVQRYVFANELEFLGKDVRQAVLANPYLLPDTS